MPIRSILFSILILGAFAWSVLPAAPVTLSPAFQVPAAAQPTFLQPMAGMAGAVLSRSAAAAGQSPLLGLTPPMTSVMPPGPQPGESCSVADTQQGTCSTSSSASRCSAFNGADNVCSAFEWSTPANNNCSTTVANSACSTLPPSNPAGMPAACSAFPGPFNLGGSQQCSALTTAARQQCSVKGQGAGICSAYDQNPVAICSVLNSGATDRSFCSTKFNQPTLAKQCSAFEGGGAACSVVAGGEGVCTSFGAADPNSCSAFAADTFCSVIGGAPGNPCVQ